MKKFILFIFSLTVITGFVASAQIPSGTFPGYVRVSIDGELWEADLPMLGQEENGVVSIIGSSANVDLNSNYIDIHFTLNETLSPGTYVLDSDGDIVGSADLKYGTVEYRGGYYIGETPITVIITEVSGNRYQLKFKGTFSGFLRNKEEVIEVSGEFSNY